MKIMYSCKAKSDQLINKFIQHKKFKNISRSGSAGILLKKICLASSFFGDTAHLKKFWKFFN